MLQINTRQFTNMKHRLKLVVHNDNFHLT